MIRVINILLIGVLSFLLIGCGNNADVDNDSFSPNYYDAEVYNNGNDTGEIIVTDVTLFEKIKSSDKVSLIYVGKPTCEACVMFYPVIEEVATEYKVDFYYTNINDWDKDDLSNILFATLYDVLYTPSIVVMYNGEMMDMITGVNEKDIFVEFLKNNKIVDNSTCKIESVC